MIVMLFWLTLRDEAMRAEHDAMNSRNREIAAATPGFVSWKDYSGPDGEIAGIAHFETEEALIAWREHPYHREAHVRAREAIYSSTRTQICSVMRESSFQWDGAPAG